MQQQISVFRKYTLGAKIGCFCLIMEKHFNMESPLHGDGGSKTGKKRMFKPFSSSEGTPKGTSQGAQSPQQLPADDLDTRLF